MNLHVLRGGQFTTVQDLGRPGLQRFGVPVGGAMDVESLRLANLLVGNRDDAAGLEMTLLGGTFQCDAECCIALTGTRMNVTCNGHSVPLGRPMRLAAGTTITCGPTVNGCRTYLAISGGINVPRVLGGRGTHVRLHLGGWQGRPLQNGDVLPLGEPTERLSRESVPWYVGGEFDDSSVVTIRATESSGIERLSNEARERFWSNEFEVTTQSDRMGYRLSGPTLSIESGGELLSEGIAAGSIQIPPDGKPIVLMADRATTGGYLVAAHVIAVDLGRLAQVRPGKSIRFERVTLEEAHAALHRRSADLAKLRRALELKRRESL